MCPGEAIAAEPVPASLDAQIKIEVRAAKLADLGEALCRNAELMIPAARASETINLLENYTTLREVIERVGLVIAGPTGTRA